MDNWKIATIASHSALNILSGAKHEGFETILFSTPSRVEFYQSFGVASEIIIVNDFSEIFNHVEENMIFIPHGSFVAYLDVDKILSEPHLRLYGSKHLLKWESDRRLKEQLMKEAGMNTPLEFSSIDEVDRPVIIKYYGAEGGRGYFVAENPEEIRAKIDPSRKFTIQEFIVGTKIYVTFFNSLMRNRVELFGADIRYETDVDAKIRFDSNPTFNIVGNVPVVLRESLLISYQTMAESFVKTARRLLGEPIPGPFCLESIIDRDLNIYVFEFSGRIVAGTNVLVPQSPYSWMMHGEPMWMGRRIAREIKEAIQEDRIDNILN